MRLAAIPGQAPVRGQEPVRQWQFPVIVFAGLKKGIEKNRIETLPACQSLVP